MRLWIAAAVAAYFLFFFQLTGMGMIGPDEPRYAWVGREMARSGDWVTPRLWEQPWFEKPALLYWMTAAAFRAGLGEDAAPRLPVACISVLFLAFFYWRLKTEFGAMAAGYATAVLATSAGWVAYSHAAVFDVPLTATFGAAMLSMLAWTERGDRRWMVAFAALLGLSALAKGLVGPALAGLTLLAWGLWRGIRSLRPFVWPVPWLVFGAVALPWYVWCYVRNGPAFLEVFFWRHHFARFTTGALEHNQPIWFFVPVLAFGLLPWTPVYAAAMWRDRRTAFLTLWAAVTLLFFSFSRDKLPGYILPALPALAALAGTGLATQKSMHVLLPLSAATLAIMPVAATILPEALNSGLRHALAQAHIVPLPLIAVAVLACVVWRAERTGRRAVAVAAITLASVAGYALVKRSAFPQIDQQAGARPMWNRAQAAGEPVCLGEVRRHIEYGLHYYAGYRVPNCTEQSTARRIDSVLLLEQ